MRIPYVSLAYQSRHLRSRGASTVRLEEPDLRAREQADGPGENSAVGWRNDQAEVLNLMPASSHRNVPLPGATLDLSAGPRPHKGTSASAIIIEDRR